MSWCVFEYRAGFPKLIGFQACLEQADILKAEGNSQFRSNRWGEALATYQAGLNRVPKKIQKQEQPSQDELSLNEDGSEMSTPDKPGQRAFNLTSSELEDCATRRAVLNANIGACYVKLVTTGISVFTPRY
jgi:hypothetical protein